MVVGAMEEEFNLLSHKRVHKRNPTRLWGALKAQRRFLPRAPAFGVQVFPSVPVLRVQRLFSFVAAP